MWPFSKDYDFKLKTLNRLKAALKGSRKVTFERGILDIVKELSHDYNIAGQYLFGRDDGEVVAVTDTITMQSTRTPSKLVVDFKYGLEVVEDAEQQGLRYLGMWLRRDAPYSVSDSDITVVQHPTSHLEDRLYVIGLARNDKLEISLVKSFTAPKKVKINKTIILFEGYTTVEDIIRL